MSATSSEGSEPKKYTLATDGGEMITVTEGRFFLRYYDSEYLMVTDEYGSFVVPLVFAFESFTGMELRPQLTLIKSH
ncbi:MAG: hypothetical protein ACM37W_08310 [Actinomycetota bacterium]